MAMRTSRLLSSLNSFKKKTKNNFLQDGNAHVSPPVQLEQLQKKNKKQFPAGWQCARLASCPA
jgi:hypothetical protein